jgi:hypothetical protein
MNPARSRPWFYQPRWLPNTVARLCVALTVIALLAGAGLRVARLDRVPPGLHPDEACNGYDAYSILTTGRDHHGDFLPIVFQGFGDFRMALFNYSLVPLVAAFGLKTAVVRLGAALWGIVDLTAATLLAGLMLGWPGAAAAALFCALSPWHFPMSRYGIEATAASAVISLALVCFFLWLRGRRPRWLLLSAAIWGLSFYTYSITKLFTPLMIALLALLYWRELKQARSMALAALGIAVLVVLPQGILFLLHSGRLALRFTDLSLFGYMAACPHCDPTLSHLGSDSFINRIENLGASWISYFTPAYLFLRGDTGDHWTLYRPPGFGQLLPEEAPLIALALLGLAATRRRRIGLLLIGWLAIAAMPAALVVPLGVWEPGHLVPPEPWVLHQPAYNVPLTPWMLLSHPDSRHDVLAMIPWILLSALGLTTLLEFSPSMPALTATMVGLLAAGTIFHGSRFVRTYFTDYPAIAAPYYQYGIEDTLKAIDQLDDGSEMIVIPRAIIKAPYIYVLFFERYPPALFQRGPVQTLWSRSGRSSDITGFGRYLFGDPYSAFARLDHGIFVFTGGDDLRVPVRALIRYPGGSPAYQVVVK